MSNPSWTDQADVVVIGMGVAGLTAAWHATCAGARVVVITKAARGVRATATSFAQGGIAVVIPTSDDSIEAHVDDTLIAGAGLCDPQAVTSIIADGYRAVCHIAELGAHFDTGTNDQWARTREGGHHYRRIIHAGGDATGAEVQRALTQATDKFDIRYEHAAMQLLTDEGRIAGVQVLTREGTGLLRAPSVIIASGGLGQLYPATTNPAGSTGDGIALALWAGAQVADLEFIQFHPTMLFTAPTYGRHPLISEAVRGEGARLIDQSGVPIMEGIHPMGDLAPRDIVAGAIQRRLLSRHDKYVYLDARHIRNFPDRFPTITALCAQAGIDPTQEPIPVLPGAHYSCGGIVTDLNAHSSIEGLFAAGEAARTGLHGANRLASNSLLEGLVMGERAGRHAAAYAQEHRAPIIAMPAIAQYPRCARGPLQEAMNQDGFVIRDHHGLTKLMDRFSHCQDGPLDSVEAIENASLALLSTVVAYAGCARTETRGCHTRSDYPHCETTARSRVITYDAGRKELMTHESSC